MTRDRRGRLAAAVLGGLTLFGTQAAVAATHSGTPLSGAGSTLIQNMMQQWTADYNNTVHVTYTGVGSGAGRAQLIAGTVDFGDSDVAASPTEAQQLNSKYGGFVSIPMITGGVAIEYNIPGVTSLKLTSPTLARIFSGTITKWNDPAVTADNGVALPPTPISVYVRSDKSGTSGVFTDYLAHTAGPAWTAGTTQQFPTNAGQIGRNGSDGVTAGVASGVGGIGYAEVSFARNANLPVVAVENASGAFTTPTTAGVTAAIAGATANPDGTLTLNYRAPDPRSYEISTTTYVLAPTTMPPDKGDNLKAFLDFALSPAEQGRADANFYAPLPDAVRRAALASVTKINAGGPSPTTPAAATPPAASPAASPATSPATSPAASPATAPADPAPLARTGSTHSVTLVVGAGAVLVLGGIALGLGRRRASTPSR